MQQVKCWIEPSEAAHYLDVSTSMIMRFISHGTILAMHLPTKQIRILSRDVLVMMLNMGREVPPEFEWLLERPEYLYELHELQETVKAEVNE